MLTTEIRLLIVLAVIFVSVFGSLLFFLRRLSRRKEAEAWERFPDARKIDRTASFFGQESRGAAQVRGAGTLILTDAELVFERWYPKTDFRIPLRSIQSLENPRSFLGKSRFTPLLKVVYTSDHGGRDSMAWQVKNLSEWMHRIEQMMEGRMQGE